MPSHDPNKRADSAATLPIPPAFSAREIFDMRRWRDANTPGDYFGEPAWDLLLQLTIAHEDGEPIGMGALGNGLGGTNGAYHRHLKRLIEDGLVLRLPADTEGAGDRYTLSAAGIRFMTTLLSPGQA